MPEEPVAQIRHGTLGDRDQVLGVLLEDLRLRPAPAGLRRHRRGEGDRLMTGVRNQCRVAGPHHRHRGTRGHTGSGAEQGVQFGVAVRRVHHRAMRRTLGSAAPQRQQHRQTARRAALGRDLARAVQRRAPDEAAQHPGGDPGDHELGLRHRPVGQLQPHRPAVLLQDPGDLRAEVELDLPGDTPLVHGPRQLPYATAHVPGSEGVLQVRQHRRARRCRPRIQAVGERVTLQEGDEPGVAQLPGTDLGEGAGPAGAQKPLVGDRRIGLAVGQHPPVRPQRFFQERSARPVPGLAGADQEVAPAVAGPGAQRVLQGGHHTRA